MLSVWILYKNTSHWEYYSAAITVLSAGLCVVCTIYLFEMRRRFFEEAPEAFSGVFSPGEDASAGPMAVAADPYTGRSSAAEAPPVVLREPSNKPGVFRRPSLSWLPGKGEASNSKGGDSSPSTQLTEASLCTPSSAGDAPSRSSAAVGGGAGRISVADKGSPGGQTGANIPLLDNPMSVVGENPDLCGEVGKAWDTPFNPVRATASQYELSGILLKRSGDGDKRLLNVREGWLERFFELKGGRLQYWKHEADYLKGERGKLVPLASLAPAPLAAAARSPAADAAAGLG